MINIPPIKQSSTVKADVIPDVTRTWKVGQVLNATTQQGGQALSNVLIRVGQHTIEAKTPIALQNGQEVKLLVKSLSENQLNNQIIKLPLLSIIEASPVLPEVNKLAAIKLRQFIAVQQSFSQLQQLANGLLNQQPGAEKLPSALKNLLNTLQQTIQINTKNLSPAQLKQKIFNSGIFLESKVLNLESQQNSGNKTENSLMRDFKYQLLTIKSELAALAPVKNQTGPMQLTPQQLDQLHTIIKQTGSNLGNTGISELTDKLIALLPKTSLIQISHLLAGLKPEAGMPNDAQALARALINTIQQQSGGNQKISQLQEQLHFRLMLLDLNQQIEQSISKITSLQLQPMSRESDNLVLLLFNLVFKDSNDRFDIDFRIQQENDKADPDEEGWLVTLSFNFNTLGKVQSKIHLVGNHVSSVFHTERADTAEKITQLLPLLESGLKKTGLNIINLSVENNLLEDKPFISNQVNLLDEKA